MDALIRGRQAIWGIVSDSGDTYASGIIVKKSRKKASDTDFVLDDMGFVIAQVFFNQNDECDVNIICESGTSQPENGDDITLNGIDCIVQESDVAWDQKGWKMLNVKAKKYANLDTEA